MTGSTFPDPDMVLRPPPKPLERPALDEKPPPEPVPISLPWRIAGWICEALFSFGGG